MTPVWEQIREEITEAVLDALGGPGAQVNLNCAFTRERVAQAIWLWWFDAVDRCVEDGDAERAQALADLAAVWLEPARHQTS